MWNYDSEAGIFRPASPHGHPSPHSHARTNAGSRGPSLQILHPPNDCNHCHAYKVHVMLACLQDDAALDSSIPETRAKLGQVTQERDNAIVLNEQYRYEVALLEKQLQVLKDEYLAFVITHSEENRLRYGDSEEEEESPPTEDDDVVEGNMAEWNPDADLEMDEPWTVESPIDQNDASDDFDTFQQLHLMTAEYEEATFSEEEDDDNDVHQETLQNPTLQTYCTDYSIDDSPSSTSSCLLSATDSSAGSQESDDDDDDDDDGSPARPDEELHQLLKLMSSAHEVGNTTALVKVKKLIVQAEKTPRHDRTKAQNYILLNWRSPGSSSRNNPASQPVTAVAPPIIYPIPSSSNGPEIFVDASPSGIGFVFKTQWLAWTFNKSSSKKIPFGPDNRVVMSWAELLAVELGLRTLITIGYRSTHITIRSDNTGVIDGLKKKSWCQQYGIEEMLQDILRLCGDYGIELRPCWIPTKMNPADKPSRGVYPPWSLVLQFPPKLPKKLVGVLKLATQPTS